MKVAAYIPTTLTGASLIYVLAAALTSSCFAQQNSVLHLYEAGRLGTQIFFCESSFPKDECATGIDILRSHVQTYPVAQLGTWTWVLVQPDHWKDLGNELGLDASSPADTSIENRLTLIDHSMLVPRSAARSAELIRKFDLPLPKLIDFAVTHEMGHALCGFKDEHKADAVGKRIRDGELPYCSVPVKVREKFPVTLQADVWGGTHQMTRVGGK